MLKYQVKRSIEIDAPSEQIHSFIADFKNWPSWSPWLIVEPDCPLKYSGETGQVGSGYRWNGDMVGEGEMELTATTPQRLEMALNFLRPFKSTAKVGFEFETVGEGCRVSWIMDSQVPWFLFFLKNMFKNMIGMDYDRGLSMLKTKIETGEVKSELQLLGDVTLDATHYVSLSGGATIDNMGEVMPGHIQQFRELVEAGTVTPNGAIFAIYSKMDMKTSYSEFETCLPITEPVTLPAPFEIKQLPQTDTYAVEHKGSYNYLGNAWSMVMMASRHFKVKVKRKPLGYERYLDDPMKVEESSLRTQILLAKK